MTRFYKFLSKLYHVLFTYYIKLGLTFYIKYILKSELANPDEKLFNKVEIISIKNVSLFLLDLLFLITSQTKTLYLVIFDITFSLNKKQFHYFVIFSENFYVILVQKPEAIVKSVIQWIYSFKIFECISTIRYNFKHLWIVFNDKTKL